MANLKDKISEVKDAHAVEVVDQMSVEHERKSLSDAIFMLGRMKQNEHIAFAVASNLQSQTVRAIEYFQQEKLFQYVPNPKTGKIGYDTITDFLNESEYSPMTKPQYYERLKLVRAHGDEIYDLLTSVGISVRSQKLLGKGELAIKGDQLMIGDRAVELADAGVIKDVLNELFDERRELDKKIAKQEQTIDEQKDRIEKGQSEFDELQRNLDALRDGDPFDAMFMRALDGMVKLTTAADGLDAAEKARRSGVTMRSLFGQFLHLRRALGANFNFEDDSNPTQAKSKGAPSLVDKVLSEDDDFGDDEEV